jgi:magnesium-transporting ATPase (P-type)
LVHVALCCSCTDDYSELLMAVQFRRLVMHAKKHNARGCHADSATRVTNLLCLVCLQGTHVTSGHCRAVVVGTGAATAIGKIRDAMAASQVSVTSHHIVVTLFTWL